MSMFEPGDVVMSQSQMHYDGTEGIAGKSLFKSTSICIMLKKISPASYLIWRLPFTEVFGKPVVPIKAIAT